MQPQDVNFHGQEQVYGDLGEEMLEHAFEGKTMLFCLYECKLKLCKKFVYFC